jgi:hypothetical protein
MSGSNDRVVAAERYVRALRTGAPTATRRVPEHLAADVVLSAGTTTIEGVEAVVDHLTGQQPSTPTYLKAGWSDPFEEGDRLVVVAEFPDLGASPSGARIVFTFDGDDKITAVEETFSRPGPLAASPAIPLLARGMINGALANGTPLVVAYVDPDGHAQLSLRGSVQVYSDTQLCAWIRSATSGLAVAIETNPELTFLYRDSTLRLTMIIKGDGRVATDDATRARVFELVPEVEAAHDPQMSGAALIVDVTSLSGSTTKGRIQFQGP